MSARAIWKGVLRLDQESVPVKFYSAVRDTGIHFRMLHSKDKMPVRQHMVNPRTEEIVPYAEARRAWQTPEGDLVVLEPEELEKLEPEAERDIHVLYFLPDGAIDPRWYDRPYYLGPDGDDTAYASLAAALGAEQREGLVRWVMRKKAYTGALRVYRGYPMVVSLRPAEQVVAAAALEPPRGRELSQRELDMARQLMATLEAEFEPEQYRNHYRERVLEMIEQKRKGGKVKKRKPQRQKSEPDDLAAALEASLDKKRKRA